MDLPLDDPALDALALRNADGADGPQIAALIEELRARRRQTALETQLQSHQAVLLKLARSEAITQGAMDEALREITETGAAILGVPHCGVWRYLDDRRGLLCLDEYSSGEALHRGGREFLSAEYPRYFAALEQARLIATPDLREDPRTAELGEGAPETVTAMVDAPIRVAGRLFGVICFKHEGRRRAWTPSQTQFAGALADFIALATESDQRRRTELELRETIEVAEQRLETIERQRQAIAALSAPLIDVWDGVIAVPLVGQLDSERSVELTERLLQRVSTANTHSVILDLTGIEFIDTMTAKLLLQMVRATALLGAFCVLSGIRPEIAQTLVGLGVDLGEATTVRSLREALATCLRRERGASS